MDKDVQVVSQIEAEKTAMYQNFANRRLLVALVSVIIGFIIYASIFVIGYTVREQNWQETTLRIVEKRLAEKCDVSISTVQRAIDRNSFLWKYLPDFEW